MGIGRDLLLLRLHLLKRRGLVLIALDEVDVLLGQDGVEVLDLLLRDLDVLETGRDLVVTEKALFLALGDELLQLLDLG